MQVFEPTIKDIAKICGVGVSTVSRAINNHPDINAETKEKIMNTILNIILKMKVICQEQYLQTVTTIQMKIKIS